MSLVHAAKVLLGKALKDVHAGDDKLATHQSRISTETTIALSSSAFTSEQPIPQKYAGDGSNISPPLQWSAIPAATKELMLVCEDPDAPFPSPYIHWILHRISPATTSLPEALPQTQTLSQIPGTQQSQNSAGTLGYTGPMPPPGHGVHHYHFQLFALSQKLFLSEKPTRDEILTALRDHVLAQGELIGTYKRD